MLKFIEYISRHKNTLKFVLIGALLLLFIGQCSINSRLRNKLVKTERVSNRNFNNYLAARDTIRLERNRYNQLVASKRSYEYDINTLSIENKEIIKRYRDLLVIEKRLKDINSLLSAQINIKDSIINSNSNIVRVNDTISMLNFSDEKNWDKYNWRTFNGSVELLRDDSTSNISIASSKFDILQGIGLKAAILNDNGVSLLKISTAYPGVTFTNIENINLVNDKLNQKQTKKGGWSIGLGVGYGVNLNNNQVISMGPNIGVGLFYSPKFLRF